MSGISIPSALKVLSPAERQQFFHRGFVYVRNAFAADDALKMQDFIWDRLRNLHGIVREDRATWKQYWCHLNRTQAHPVFRSIGTPRLLGAIDDLLGESNWSMPKHWGLFLCSPPKSTENWCLTQDGWHWDSPPESQSGVVVFSFFSHVKEHEGGTQFIEGAHLLLERFFANLTEEERKLDHRRLKRRFERSHPWLAKLNGVTPGRTESGNEFFDEFTDGELTLRAREATGEPGDALICPAWFYHAAPSHHENNPRFMRLAAVRLKKLP